MIPHHVYYQLVILGLLWLCVMLHYVWPSRGALSSQPLAEPMPPQRKRKRTIEAKPLALSHITENRKVEACKSLIFWYPIFAFCLKRQMCDRARPPPSSAQRGPPDQPDARSDCPR